MESWQPRIRRPLRSRQGGENSFCAGAKLRVLVAAFGMAAMCDMFDIEKAELKRYTSGTDEINGELARRIIDVEYVLARALLILHEDEVGAWLISPEPLLGNATPLNALAIHGVGPVIAAIEGLFAGVLS